MTLVKLTLKSASVVTTMTYVWNTSTNNKTETPSSDKTVKMADGSFKTDNGFVTPYYKGKVSSTDASEVYYYISQPGTSKKIGSTTTDSHVCWYEGDVTIPSNLTKNAYYELSVKSHAEGRGWVNYIGEFSYCETIQTFIAPIAGTFKLECWGGRWIWLYKWKLHKGTLKYDKWCKIWAWLCQSQLLFFMILTDYLYLRSETERNATRLHSFF